MDIKVNQIQPEYDNDEVVGLRINFTGDMGTIRLNGYMPFEKGEFEEFLKIDKAEKAIEDKAIERIVNGEDPVE